MINSILIWFVGLIIFLMGAFFSICAYPLDLWKDGSGDLIHLVSRYFGKSLLWVSRIKIQVQGLDNLLTDRAQLICANHQSLFDILILDSIIPLQFRFVVKKELFSVPILGLCLRYEKQIQVDRQNRRKGIESIRAAGDTINKGRSIVVFPEGTRSTDGEVKRFHKGSLLIAFNTNAPIVPVSINGSFSIMSKKSFRLRPGLVKVVIHPPIETKGLSRAEQKEMAEKVRQIVIADMAS